MQWTSFKILTIICHPYNLPSYNNFSWWGNSWWLITWHQSTFSWFMICLCMFPMRIENVLIYVFKIFLMNAVQGRIWTSGWSWWSKTSHSIAFSNSRESWRCQVYRQKSSDHNAVERCRTCYGGSPQYDWNI